MKPPVAATKPHVHTEHGVERDDPYYWLRDKKNPEVIAYLEEENAYTKAATAHLEPLAKTLYDEMLGRIQETDTGPKIERGPWRYYTRTVEGLAYAIHCREPRDGGGEEQVLLDENQLAESHEYTSVAAVVVSPDHRRIAYTVDHSGDEIYTLVVVDLSTGQTVDRIEGVSAGFCWGTTDADDLFWREIDDAQRPWRVRHRLLPGGAPGDDRVIFEEPDDRFRCGMVRTSTGHHLCYAAHAESTEYWLLHGEGASAELRCLQERRDGLVYDVEVAHDLLFIRSTDGDDPARKAPTFRLYTAPMTASSRDDWSVHLDARDGVDLEDLAVFRNFLVRQERVDGVVRLVVVDRGDGTEHTVQMPEDSYVASLAWSPEYDGMGFHYRYSSMTTPPSTFRYEVPDRLSRLLKRTPVPGYDPSAYTSARLWATADDGTRIPVSLVWRGDGEVPKHVPVLLYGYGSYGITIEPGFSPTRVSLLDRGVVFAIAHIRGGGYLGRAWYEAAKFHTKERTFDDFVAVGRHLVREGITTRERLGIMGGSAGGMLMGAVMNRAPDLCTAVLSLVPFVDVVTTMLDESLPLTAGEWVEWGDPRQRDFFDSMLAYSPYDNVAAVDYPDVLVRSGLNDPRVQYWEPTKWVAKLRATATGGQVLLKTHMGAGHQGQSGRYGYLEDMSFEYAWMLSKLVPEVETSR
jgi:oligopeptidase B